MEVEWVTGVEWVMEVENDWQRLSEWLAEVESVWQRLSMWWVELIEWLAEVEWVIDRGWVSDWRRLSEWLTDVDWMIDGDWMSDVVLHNQAWGTTPSIMKSASLFVFWECKSLQNPTAIVCYERISRSFWTVFMQTHSYVCILCQGTVPL